MNMLAIVITLWVAVVGLCVALVRVALAHRRTLRRYGSIIDVDHEISQRRDALNAENLARVHEIEAARRSAAEEVASLMRESAAMREQYATSKGVYDRLHAQLSLLEQYEDDLSFGLYKPTFAFDSSDEYKRRLTDARERQKEMIRRDEAVRYGIPWLVGNSRKDGERMQKQYSKLMLRAFNGECDAASAKVSWNNVTRMIERIEHAFEAINKLGGVMQIELTHGYRDLKLDELRLEYGFEQKKHAEQEEQRELREQMRDEERAQAEIEKARKEAEDEESRSQKALEKARKELAKAHGNDVAALQAKIATIEADLNEAQQAKQRAISRAQLTKAGHVYIISNIGSFGDTVYKIGMTRRLEPMDRVRELGDASVPFHFDVHAMIPSDDAPSLENQLHKHFHERRVNMVNLRREFFHVGLDEIEAFAQTRGLSIRLTKTAEAQQYRETLEMKRKRTEAPRRKSPSQAPTSFPASL